LRQIRAAHNDDSVRAILLEINSPGGAITPTDEIYAALQRFRQSDSNRVVVACCRDIMASGGYYVGLAADRIIAQPTSVIGSIGVLIQSLNWAELSERIGVQDTTVKSGENKDLFNPFRPVTEGERVIMQSLVDGFYERFVHLVSDARSLPIDEVVSIADGRVMTADEALDLNLVDRIGYDRDAVDELAQLLDQPSVRIVRYEEGDRFFLRLARMISPIRIADAINRTPPSFEYRWNP
jgi:protease-4